MERARRVSVTAVFAAGALASMYVGLLLPAVSLSMAALAGLFTAAAVIEGGYGTGALCFGAAGILGLILFPAGPGTILYLGFFGGYPLVKSFAERRRWLVLSWGIKLFAFLLALTLFLTVLGEFVLVAIPFAAWSLPLVYAVGILAFVAYDIGLGKLIGFYLARIYKHRNRW